MCSSIYQQRSLVYVRNVSKLLKLIFYLSSKLEPVSMQLNMNHVNILRHEISDYVVCATSRGSDQPAHTPSLTRVFASRWEYYISVKLLTEQHFEFLSLKRGCTGSCQNATLFETHVAAHLCWLSPVAVYHLGDISFKSLA